MASHKKVSHKKSHKKVSHKKVRATKVSVKGHLRKVSGGKKIRVKSHKRRSPK